MWRALVMAAGLSLCLLGGEFMVVDRMVLANSGQNVQANSYLDDLYGNSTYRSNSSLYSSSLDQSRKRVFVPPEWAPWGFLSAGVLTVLYGAAIPRR